MPAGSPAWRHRAARPAHLARPPGGDRAARSTISRRSAARTFLGWATRTAGSPLIRRAPGGTQRQQHLPGPEATRASALDVAGRLVDQDPKHLRDRRLWNCYMPAASVSRPTTSTSTGWTSTRAWSGSWARAPRAHGAVQRARRRRPACVAGHRPTTGRHRHSGAALLLGRRGRRVDPRRSGPQCTPCVTCRTRPTSGPTPAAQRGHPHPRGQRRPSPGAGDARSSS